ncbi:FG-GAP repeat protein [Streptomyces sp. NPDC056909]|uniref:FG-GAP repeat protein n=1 Tax=Streptomyces sp. NPDC056909 TaxID=3345963 RepID=UPI0036BA72A9
MTYRRLAVLLATSLTPLTLPAPAAQAATPAKPYDFNGDGRADLAIGAPGDSTGTATTTGSVTVLYGSAAGLTTKGATTYTQNTAGIPDTEEKSDLFGGRMSLLDHSGDRRRAVRVGAGRELGRRRGVVAARHAHRPGNHRRGELRPVVHRHHDLRHTGLRIPTRRLTCPTRLANQRHHPGGGDRQARPSTARHHSRSCPRPSCLRP